MNIYKTRRENVQGLPLTAGGGLLLDGYAIQEADNQGFKNLGSIRYLDERVAIRG